MTTTAPFVVPPLLRWIQALAGLCLLALSLVGVSVALGGQPPPGHPYAELTLGLLGGNILLMAGLGSGNLTALALQGVMTVLGLCGAGMWALSAFHSMG